MLGSAHSTAVLFASELFRPLFAFLAFHITAPMKLAVTIPSSDDLMSIVASSTAQKLTTARTRGGSVALTLHRTRNSFHSMFVAVIRRLVDVNQIFR